MDNALIILRQIGIMFFYLAIGCLLFRFDLLTKEGSRSLANLLIYISLPCAIIQSFCVSDGPEIRQALLPSLFLGALLLLLSMAISAVLFHQEPLQNFGAAFSNAGFMGIPLISSSLGEQAVFFSAGFTAMLNILQWTYGQRLLSRQKTKRPWQALLNPLMIGFLIGLALFFSKVTLPSAVLSCLSALSGLNAPLAMITVGAYLAQTDFHDMVFTARNYWVCAVRLVLIPLMSITLLSLFSGVSVSLRYALLIAACAPIGANVAVYAQRLNGNYTYAVQLVCLSTLLSIITMPLIMGLAGVLWA